MPKFIMIKDLNSFGDRCIFIHHLWRRLHNIVNRRIAGECRSDKIMHQITVRNDANNAAVFVFHKNEERSLFSFFA